MGKVKFILFNAFVYMFCAFLCFSGVIHYFDDYGKADAIRSGVIVQAEWVGIVPNSHGQYAATYDLGYEYIDDNRIIYREKCVFGFSSVDEAESFIGKKVDIYIDGKGHSIPVYRAAEFNQNTAWALMGTAIGIVVSYTTGLIIWGVINHRRKTLSENEDTPSDIEQTNA